MWDLKLFIVDAIFFLNLFCYNATFYVLNSLDPLLLNGLLVFNWKLYYQFAQNTAFFFGLKFLSAIAFLILIRGGTPRYRYDYLTKLGWLKFLGLVILVFFVSLLVLFVF